MIPGTDFGSFIRRCSKDVEHFVGVGVVVDRTALLVEAPLLVLVSRLVVVHHQPVGTFDNENKSFYAKSDAFTAIYISTTVRRCEMHMTERA